jgi:hypothetical protein
MTVALVKLHADDNEDKVNEAVLLVADSELLHYISSWFT